MVHTHAALISLKGIGLACGSVGCYLLLDRYVNMRAAKSSAKPEHRLPFLFVGSFVMPAGLFLYGWTAEAKCHWILPILGTWLIGIGQSITNIPARTYLADAFVTYAASAIAAGVFFRTIAGAILPLAGPPLYDNLGLGWGNSILGLVALAFVPLPVIFYRYGEALRGRFPIDV